MSNNTIPSKSRNPCTDDSGKLSTRQKGELYFIHKGAFDHGTLMWQDSHPAPFSLFHGFSINVSGLSYTVPTVLDPSASKQHVATVPSTNTTAHPLRKYSQGIFGALTNQFFCVPAQSNDDVAKELLIPARIPCRFAISIANPAFSGR